jgi:ATP-dependent RNA helicase DeaD
MYVHRVGRTGRAEAPGTALTLVAPEEMDALRLLEKSFDLRIEEPVKKTLAN